MTKLRVVTSPSGARFTVADEYGDKFSGLVADLEAAGYGINPNASGGYNPRNIRGSNKPSNHAFGRAIDVNWDRNALGTKGEINPELARSLAAKHGMTWGGDWSRPDPMHFEIAGVPNVPVSQRGITRVAGVQKTQPMTTEPLETMPTYKNVGGVPVTSPQEVERQQALAKALMSGGMDGGTPRHWSEALGNVLMSGVGMYKGKQAAEAEAQGQTSGNQALAQLLAGGDATAAVENPYSSERALEYQQQQKMLADRTAAAMELQKAKIAAQNADPMRQLQMENIRSQLAERGRKIEVDERRTKELLSFGLDPNSAEGLIYRANGKLPESASKEIIGRQQKAKAGPQVAKGLDNLLKMAETYDDVSFESAVGPFQGADPDAGGLMTAPMANIARAAGEVSNWWGGGKSAPSEVRSNIRGTTEALAAAIKPLIRGPGEGVWTDADQARLVSIVGDLAQASTKDEFKRRLNAVRDRIRSNFNIDVPFEAIPVQGAETTLPDVEVPQSSSPGWKIERQGTK